MLQSPYSHLVPSIMRPLTHHRQPLHQPKESALNSDKILSMLSRAKLGVLSRNLGAQEPPLERSLVNFLDVTNYACILTRSSADADKPSRRVKRSVNVTKHGTIFDMLGMVSY